MPFRSPFSDVTLSPLSLPDHILRGVDGVRNELALVDIATNRAWNYGQFAQAVRAVGAALAKRGISKGDRVSVLSPNCPEYVIASLGIMQAGGIVTTINPLYTETEMAHHFQDATPRMLVATPALFDKARGVAEAAGTRQCVVFGKADGAESFDVLMAERDTPPRVSFAVEDDVAAMLYSSGTTGMPKGVMLTHRNLTAALEQIETLLGAEGSRSLCFLPLFHIFAFEAVANFDLWKRGTVYTMPRFEFEPFLAAIERYRIQKVCLVPPIVLALVKSPLVEKYDLSSLELLFSGAAPLDADLAAACERRIGCQVRQGYGLTETSPPICSHPRVGEKVRHGSVGVLTRSTEAKLVDLETGEEAAPGQPGELWVRGPQIMKGYYNRPAETRDMLQPDGWLRTGDIAVVDEDNWITIVDRAKELIKYKGLQVAPAELEAVLLSHPGIADAAVIGVADEEAGEVPKAFVVRREAVSAGEVQAWVAERVAPYKKIRHLEFVEAIPKSPSGKILRRVLRDLQRKTAGAD
ncbi:MAG: AMP-binding protein [Bryobacterales bacterium]|nr:AMP-binding protein [Bryobacterales bacterium]